MASYTQVASEWLLRRSTAPIKWEVEYDDKKKHIFRERQAIPGKQIGNEILTLLLLKWSYINCLIPHKIVLFYTLQY